jgi:hypothetical protein
MASALCCPQATKWSLRSIGRGPHSIGEPADRGRVADKNKTKRSILTPVLYRVVRKGMFAKPGFALSQRAYRWHRARRFLVQRSVRPNRNPANPNISRVPIARTSQPGTSSSPTNTANCIYSPTRSVRPPPTLITNRYIISDSFRFGQAREEGQSMELRRIMLVIPSHRRGDSKSIQVKGADGPVRLAIRARRLPFEPAGIFISEHRDGRPGSR